MGAINGQILVVDDDADIREVLKDRLEYLGYRVTLASHGNEGLQQVEKNGLNMVFLDIQMPDMSGLDVLREIRRRGHQIPVAMITAYGSIDRAVEAMKQGAYDFITKPFDPDYIALVAGKGMERQQVQREIEIPSEEVGARHHLVRACLIEDHFSAKQGVEDDDLNIICLGGRIERPELAWDLVQTFLAAEFSRAERHLRRLGKVMSLEAGT
jgi:DNA-binding NtrC family response regulator